MSGHSQITMPRQRDSVIWEYFNELDNGKVAECKKCKKQINIFGGSTGNMWQHANNKHGILNPGSKSYKNAVAADSRSSTVSSQPKVDKMMTKMAKMSPDCEQYQDITLFLCKYIIKECIPIYKVESQTFKDLMQAMNPK